MMYAIGIALFALGLLVSVALHECGHMWVARATGISAHAGPPPRPCADG